MIITIVRHGEAGSAARDKDRELTDNGIDDVSFGSRQLHDLCLDKSLPMPDRILHSAWRRTTQTAEILAAGFTASVDAFDALLPGHSNADVDNALTPLPSGTSHCLLVGHQPMVSELVDHYLDDMGRVPALSPGGLVSIRLEFAAQGGGELLFWAMPPEYGGYV